MNQNESAHNPQVNLEEVLTALDLLVFTKTGKHLKDVELSIFRGAWQGKTYEQIVENNRYSLTYIKQAAGPKLWKLLAKVLEENVSKSNLRSLIEKRWDNTLRPILTSVNHVHNSKLLLGQNQQETLPVVSSFDRVRDWGEAPDVSIFYGRKQELALLRQWVVKDSCRLVAIIGTSGIGKTALSVRSAQQVEQEFESVIWRSLRHAPSGEQLIRDLLVSLPGENRLASILDDPVSQLIEYLQRHRCLILLDNVETIMRSRELAGYYQEQYQDYQELLQRLADASHQSCLIITSREQLKEIALLEGETLPVRSLQLNWTATRCTRNFGCQKSFRSR